MLQQVKDNASLGRYELAKDGVTAFLTYRRAPGSITLVHTEVPPAIGGQGVGSALARAALEAARSQADKVVVTCRFIAAYLDRHPEYRDLVASSA